jgi:hypothetical protein
MPPAQDRARSLPRTPRYQPARSKRETVDHLGEGGVAELIFDLKSLTLTPTVLPRRRGEALT